MDEMYIEKEHTFTIEYKEIPVRISFPGEYMDEAIKASKLCKELGLPTVEEIHTVKRHVLR